MTFIRKWLRREPTAKVAAGNGRQSVVRSLVFSGRRPGADSDADTSFSRSESDYWDVPESLRGTDDEKSSSDTVTVRTLTCPEDCSYIVEEDAEEDVAPVATPGPFVGPALTIEEDAGLDPYNTGRPKVTRSY